MQLPVMVPHGLYPINPLLLWDHGNFSDPKPMLSLGNCQGIIRMGFIQLQQLCPSVLGNVTLRLNNRDRQFLPKPLKQRLPHDSHEGSVSHGRPLPLFQHGQLDQALVKVLDVTFREPFTDQGYTWEGTAVVIAPDALEHLDLGSIKITRDNVTYTREDAEKLL